jgi:hypothetical protein
MTAEMRTVHALAAVAFAVMIGLKLEGLFTQCSHNTYSAELTVGRRLLFSPEALLL